MAIKKSSRHQKIIGEFGEHLLCNWLSRSGIEVARVDHTGIDVIAYDPDSNRRMGITVKSRTRIPGREEAHVRLFGLGDRDKLVTACESFGCKPYVAVYVETMSYADLYLVSLEAYEASYAISGRLPTTWRMTQRYRTQYSETSDVWHLRVHFEPANWKWHSDGSVTIKKAHLARLVEILPENADLATANYELTLMHSLDVRRAHSDAGEPTIPQEEVAKYFQEKYGIQIGD